MFNYRTLSGWLVNDRRRREVCIKPYVSEFCKATCLYIHKLVWDHSIELVLLQPMKETGSQIMHLGELSLHRVSLSRPDSCTLCPKGLYLHCLSRHSTLLLPKCPPPVLPFPWASSTLSDVVTEQARSEWEAQLYYFWKLFSLKTSVLPLKKQKLSACLLVLLWELSRHMLNDLMKSS